MAGFSVEIKSLENAVAQVRNAEEELKNGVAVIDSLGIHGQPFGAMVLGATNVTSAYNDLLATISQKLAEYRDSLGAAGQQLSAVATTYEEVDQVIAGQ